MSALLDHLWQSTLFGAAAWLLTLALAANRAAVRHALWLAASLKFLLPFSLLVLAGEWLGDAPGYEAAAASSLDAALRIASPLVAPVAVHSGGAGFGFPWLGSLMLAWAAGAVVVASRWLAAWRAARTMVRDATPIALAGAWRGEPEFGLDVRASLAAGEPAVAGMFRPVVLVPAGLVDALSRDELRVVLAHEGEHIARRDNLTTGVHMLVETLFWFHPMVWWIGRRLIDERERACDEAVIDAGHEARNYAAGILAVCRHCCAERRVPGAVAALSGNLPQRIRRIVCGAQPLGLGLVKAMALSSLALALVAVPVAAGAIRDEHARHETFMHDLRVLRAASVSIVPAQRRGPARVIAREHELRIDGTTIPELVALAYGVDAARINGADGLGAQRYDFIATVASGLADPEQFDPAALQGVVNELVATRFRFEVYVNNRCQAPCGPRAPGIAPR